MVEPGSIVLLLGQQVSVSFPIAPWSLSPAAKRQAWPFPTRTSRPTKFPKTSFNTRVNLHTSHTAGFDGLADFFSGSATHETQGRHRQGRLRAQVDYKIHDQL